MKEKFIIFRSKIIRSVLRTGFTCSLEDQILNSLNREEKPLHVVLPGKRQKRPRSF